MATGNFPLSCSCNPETGVVCDRALALMDSIRDAISMKGTPFAFRRLEADKQALAAHYREGEEARACFE